MKAKESMEFAMAEMEKDILNLYNEIYIKMNKNNFWLNDIFLIALSLFLLSIISTCSSKAQNDFNLDIRFIGNKWKLAQSH